MNELPENWAKTTLGEVASQGQYGWTTSATNEGSVKFLRTTDITHGRVNWETVPFCQDVPPSLDNYKIQLGDILISRAGSVGFSALIDDIPSVPSVFASYLIRYNPSQKVNAKFVFHFLNSPDYWQQISDASAGIALANVNAKKLANVVLPLPPLPEQKRIADKLDTLLARVDSCQAHLARVPQILKRFRQSVLAAATSGRLTDDWRASNPAQNSGQSIIEKIRVTHETAGGHKAGNAAAPTEGVHDLTSDTFPDGWEIADLREVVRPDRPITYGILKPGPDFKDGIPYIRVADYPNDQLSFDGIRRTSPKMDREFKRSKLEAGDILLSIRGTVGRLIVIPSELAGANITQDSARLSLQLDVDRDYVLWYLRSEIAQSRMRKAVKGVAVRGINIGDVRALQVPIPSNEEQHEIVRRVETLFALADRLEARWLAAQGRVASLTPSLLAKAFRGELVKQDPNDEPAKVMLEKISKKSIL